MDYVQEELLRQERILATLLYGGQVPKAIPADQVSAPPPTEADRVSPAERLGTQGASGGWSGTAPPTDRAAGAEEGETLPAAGQTTAGPAAVHRQSSARRGQRGRAALPQGGAVQAVSPRPDRELFRASDQTGRAAADVRAVSRAIQRDARRYDGGFTIY